MTEKQGEPEAFGELTEEHDEEWTAVIAAFRKKHGRLPEGEEAYDIAMALWKKYYG